MINTINDIQFVLSLSLEVECRHFTYKISKLDQVVIVLNGNRLKLLEKIALTLNK